MTDTERMILGNQAIILAALSLLIANDKAKVILDNASNFTIKFMEEKNK